MNIQHQTREYNSASFLPLFLVCLSHLVWRSYFYIAFIKVTSKIEINALQVQNNTGKDVVGTWNVALPSMTQNCLISLLGVNKPTLSRIVLTEMGVPVLTLSNGKSYTYNPNMVCWWVVLWILSTQNFFIAQNKIGQIFIFKPRYINIFYYWWGGGSLLTTFCQKLPFFLQLWHAK